MVIEKIRRLVSREQDSYMEYEFLEYLNKKGIEII